MSKQTKVDDEGIIGSVMYSVELITFKQKFLLNEQNTLPQIWRLSEPEKIKVQEIEKQILLPTSTPQTKTTSRTEKAAFKSFSTYF